MRTARAFSSTRAYSNTPLLALWLILIVAGWLGGVFSAWGQELPLPKQIGALNDYAAAIGSSRPALQTALSALQSQAGVRVTILITLLDPFDDPSQLAARIRTNWKIEPKKAVFALYVKESDRWQFRLWLSPDLGQRLAGSTLTDLQAQVSQALLRRRVAQAVRETVAALSKALLPPKEGVPPKKGPPTSAERGAAQQGGNLALLYWGGGLLAAVLLVIGIHWLLYRLCPRCGGRLRARQGRGQRVYYCERCGARFTRPRAR